MFWFQINLGLVVGFSTVLRLAGAAETIEFNYRLPQQGQKSAYDVDFDMDVKVSIQRNGEATSTNRQHLRRSQSRDITVLKTLADRPMKVQIHFVTARETITRDSEKTVEKAQPIEGKQYLVERTGTGLVITDIAGNAVPEEEQALVATSTESVGRRNQLARFLHGRTITVGEVLELPKETAAELLGMSQARGDAQTVNITLRRIGEEQGLRVAEFETSIATKMATGGTMNMEGQMRIDVDSCRMIAAEFTGPVSDRTKFQYSPPPSEDGRVAQAGHQEPVEGVIIETSYQGTLQASVKARPIAK